MVSYLLKILNLRIYHFKTYNESIKDLTLSRSVPWNRISCIAWMLKLSSTFVNGQYPAWNKTTIIKKRFSRRCQTAILNLRKTEYECFLKWQLVLLPKSIINCHGNKKSIKIKDQQNALTSIDPAADRTTNVFNLRSSLTQFHC